MSTGLSVFTTRETALTTQSEEDAIFKQLSSAGSYLPRLEFKSSASEIVKADQFEKNHWALCRNKDELEDLGKEVEVIVVDRRFKALDLRGGDVLSYFTFSSPQFQTVHTLAGIKDSQCMSGTEFLIWVPSVREFCTFFAYNVSSKREAPKIWALKGKPGTLKSKWVPNTKEPKKSFQAIMIVASSISPSVEDCPEAELLETTVTKFKNPTDSAASAVSATDTAATSRAQ